MSIYHEAKGSIVLKIIIVILLGVLIWVLYEPYKIREQEALYRKESRLRMVNIRTAQLKYIETYSKYAGSVTELVEFIKQQMAVDSIKPEIFLRLTHGAFVPESLLHSPKTWKLYEITAIDTARFMKFYVEDPDGYGSIGSLTDDSKINKASWEE